MSKVPTTHILKRLRGLIGDFHALIVPSEDAHYSEMTNACDARRAFISGFDGSAGSAIITHTEALMWTDGRYHLQAQQQMDENWKLMPVGLPDTPTQVDWITKNLPENSKIGFDPWIMSHLSWKPLNEKLSKSKLTLVPLYENPIDKIWTDRPKRPNNPLRILPLSFTGRSPAKKVESVRAKMKLLDADVCVVSCLDEVAWLLNLRGSDIPNNPVFYAYAVILHDEVHLFINESKLNRSDGLRDYLQGLDVNLCVHRYEDIQHFISMLTARNNLKTFLLDVYASYALFSIISEDKLLIHQSPVAQLKAVKTPEEIEGMRHAHVIDAIALCDYLSFLEETLSAPSGDCDLTEYSAACILDKMRSEMDGFVSLSFETISSSGPNGAIIHYRPNETDSRKLSANEVYLVDSGGQYETGTTDVTRTLHFGQPSQAEVDAFTQVLKGVIALSSLVFPTDTPGSRIDAVARAPLWRYGLEYMHGTGHGVGAFLNVHEGPCGLSGSRNVSSLEAGLVKGMVITIEPGFYAADAFGIRTENVYAIVEATTEKLLNPESLPSLLPRKQFLTFEPLTLVPIQQKMINKRLLMPHEIYWLNDYHQKCRSVLTSEFEKRGKKRALSWFLRETERISA